MSAELRFRKALGSLFKTDVRPAERYIDDVLHAFKTVLSKDVQPASVLFSEVAMDSLDLFEVTNILDAIYGDREWDDLWKAAGTTMVLTPQMMADFLDGPNYPRS